MAYATLEFNNFQDIDQALGVRRSLPLALNTFAYRTGHNESEIAISYHGNDISIHHEDGAITLQTCGWTTPTTVDRLDQIARGNGIGTVSTVGGRVRFTHRAKDYGWHHIEISITVNVNRPGIVRGNDVDRYDANGYSNRDTYLAASWCHNPEGGELEYRALLNMRRYELREFIKSNRNGIGYKSIADVNIAEIHHSLHEED